MTIILDPWLIFVLIALACAPSGNRAAVVRALGRLRFGGA